MYVRRLGYALGAQVTEVDLAKPLDDETVADIRKTWLENILLVFPGQDLTREQLAAFSARFGKIDDNRATPHLRHPNDEGVIVFVNKATTVGDRDYKGQVANKWHTDNSYTLRPNTGSILNAKELPEIGGDTMFANTYMAYDTLSASLRALVDPLEAVHDISLGAGFKAYPERQAERRRLTPPVVHPVVQIHPETGRKALFLGERVRNFVGFTEEETKPLLDFLNQHATRYEFIYRHRWTNHDLLMWDNRCALHYAIPDYDRSQFRRMQRCALIGARTGRFDIPDTVPASLDVSPRSTVA